MSERPYMPLYTADYRDATAHLSAAQHGAYLLLLMNYWAKGSLPTDDRMLARIACMSDREWKANRDVIAAFFDDDWKHERVEKELEKARTKSAARAEFGARGGQAKALKNKEVDVAKATVLPEQTASKTPSKTLPSSSGSGTEEKKESPPSVDVHPLAKSELDEAIESFNSIAGKTGWAKVQRLTEARKGQLRARLKEAGGLVGWNEAIERGSRSKFLNGANDRGWKANFDFFISQQKFTNLMEGSYDDRPIPATGHATNGNGARAHQILAGGIRHLARQDAAGRQAAGEDGDYSLFPDANARRSEPASGNHGRPPAGRFDEDSDVFTVGFPGPGRAG